MDRDFEVPLPGVKVRVSETGQETETGDAGSYYLEDVDPGAYTLLFSKDGYARGTKPEVVVTAGQLAEVDVDLAGEYEEMDELVVRDIQLGGASEIGLLNLRMESSSIMDSVGADLMSQAGASDAASALKLVAGTTVQDGKYAVVRGLPDRYVVSQMNDVRLPSADPDKRAVQLDQFPSALIESIQVSKTFTPDQQGDASGGAVNVILKGIPDEPVLKLKVGTKYKSQVSGRDDFLSYDGGGLDFWGTKADSRQPQESGTNWKGAVGVDEENAPLMYGWNLTAGGKHSFDNDATVGAMFNFYYKQDASFMDGGVNDKYRANSSGKIVPDTSGGDDFRTSLFDVWRGSEEVQWGTLGAVGFETDRHAIMLLHMLTHTAEDKASLEEDTRGKEYFFPNYDPYDLNHPGNHRDRVEVAPYLRNQTLEYIERETQTLQLKGEHTIPFPELGFSDVLVFSDPELEWIVSRNSSSLDSPDKRLFGSAWIPAHVVPGIPRFGVPDMTNTAAYFPNKPAANFTMGNTQRIWKEVVEDGDQVSMSGKLPFEQWNNAKGFVELGLFNDKVRREYRQESFSNLGDNSAHNGDWSDPWSNYFPAQNYHPMQAAEIDVSYDGKQDISAWYGMIDLPLHSSFKVVGGARAESTDLSITLYPDDAVLWVPPGSSGSEPLDPGEGDVKYAQDDILPSLGLELTPVDSLSLRASYSETVARQTFKELTPIQQTEYLGGDVFIGNPYLAMSELDNYDLRLDYAPYPGGLLSLSWFYKDIVDPIEYVQDYAVNVGSYTTARNYPEGRLSGYEIELRQHLGRFWKALDGVSVGANATFIDSEVTLPDDESDFLASLGYPEKTRDMLNAPEYLYNINVTYDISGTGTQLGLFYIVQGDTLVTGAGQSSGSYVPSVYATEYDSLNFSVSQRVGKYFKLGFKAKNLTNPAIQEVYRSQGGDVVKESYTKGIEYSIDLSASW